MAQLSYHHTGIKAGSHSRYDALNTCERKAEIEAKLGRVRKSNQTFAYGHGFGEGVQAVFEGKSWRDVVFHVFSTWEIALDFVPTESEVKNKKDIWYCILAVEKFYLFFHNESFEEIFAEEPPIDFKEWEIAEVVTDEGETIKAVELEVVIECGDGHYYENHIDLVIRNKETGKFAILELKSSGLNKLHPSMFGNSPQPTGYMMGLDIALVGNDTIEAVVEFNVYYLILQTKTQMFTCYEFIKNPLHRLQWITYILAKQGQIDLLEERGLPYPPNFHGCYAYYRPCYWYGICHLDDAMIIRKHNLENTYAEPDKPPHFTVSLDDIITRQQALLEVYEATEQVIVIEGLDEATNELLTNLTW